MKSILSQVLTVSLSLSLAACGGHSSKEKTKPRPDLIVPSTPEAEKPIAPIPGHKPFTHLTETGLSGPGPFGLDSNAYCWVKTQNSVKGPNDFRSNPEEAYLLTNSGYMLAEIGGESVEVLFEHADVIATNCPELDIVLDPLVDLFLKDFEIFADRELTTAHCTVKAGASSEGDFDFANLSTETTLIGINAIPVIKESCGGKDQGFAAAAPVTGKLFKRARGL